jgi:hypothetical protein
MPSPVRKLDGFGLITCDHCVRNDENGQLLNDLIIFKSNDRVTRIKVTVKTAHPQHDVALLTIEEGIMLNAPGLIKGKSDVISIKSISQWQVSQIIILEILDIS